MLLQKTKVTNRKFYGKWLYKTSLRLEGCSVLRSKSLDDIILFCQEDDPHKNPYSIWQKAWYNRENIEKFCLFLSGWSKNSYSLRIENSCVDVYTNDKSFYDDISSTFEELLIHRFAPSEANIDLLSSDRNYITVDKLPKDRYNYRVYLLPHKMNGDKLGKQKFIDWMDKQTPKLTCTSAIKTWFLTTDWNWDRRYILVEDESMLLMLKLRNAEVVGRVYNFIVSDK
jgi:hypothetical protein